MKDKHGKVIYEPYRIKVLNTINFKKSMHYNPFAYIHSEKDILKLVTTLIALSLIHIWTIQRRRLPTPLRTSAAIPLMGDQEFSMKFEPRLY